MSTVQTITEASLSEIPYHQLKDKLNELKLGSCWRGGKKKSHIIKDVLSKLGIVKGLEEKGLSQEEIDGQLALVDAEKESADSKAETAKIEQEDKEEEEMVKDIVEKQEIDIDSLLLQLKRIKGNLKSGPKSHTKILLTRKAYLIALLKENGVNLEE